MKMKIKNKLWNKDKLEITKYFTNEAYAYGFLAGVNTIAIYEYTGNLILTILNAIVVIHCITKIISINTWRKEDGKDRKTRKENESKKNENTA